MVLLIQKTRLLQTGISDFDNLFVPSLEMVQETMYTIDINVPSATEGPTNFSLTSLSANHHLDHILSLSLSIIGKFYICAHV